MPLAPMGQHTWRQIMGMAPARNYFEENSPFLKPAQDIRLSYQDDGAIYYEFPALYWVIGQTYKVTGYLNANSRIIILLIGLFLLVGSYRLIRLLGFKLNY